MAYGYTAPTFSDQSNESIETQVIEKLNDPFTVLEEVRQLKMGLEEERERALNERMLFDKVKTAEDAAGLQTCLDRITFINQMIEKVNTIGEKL